MTDENTTNEISNNTDEQPITKKIGYFLIGFAILVVLAVLSVYISQNKIANVEIGKGWGFEYVVIAILIGLILRSIVDLSRPLSNAFEKIKPAFKTELLVKIGLVLLGAEISIGTLLAYGVRGLTQALIVVLAVYYVSLWVARKLEIDLKFAHMLSTAVSICGVSAAIATFGAIKGEKKHLNMTLLLVAVFVIPMFLGMPLLAKAIGMNQAWAGAWFGGTIDTTAAVVGAGSFYGDGAMKAASVVKMSQNVLIGFVAFLLAFYFTTVVEKSGEKVSTRQIWDRFPKFIIGFAAVTIITSLGLLSTGAIDTTKLIRSWIFAFAFVSIGAETSIREFSKIGKAPFITFTIAQAFNIVWTLIISYILFSALG
ncbi:MAG: putative sulfate exporter family transporter [Candidatus Methanoperedens sp.]|nr:putative sulfate exporter family transporter [Candidatus Methanoperedens sp.]MCZ7405479.1 putative sulfate exporter family transporter [Candidatus Methanoperedens sp.]